MWEAALPGAVAAAARAAEVAAEMERLTAGLLDEAERAGSTAEPRALRPTTDPAS